MEDHKMTVPSTNPLLSYLSTKAQERKYVSFGGAPVPGHVTKHVKPLSLGGGRPNSGFFPVNKITLEITSEPFKKSNQTKVIGKEGEDSLNLEISNGFQYGPTEGFPHLHKFAKELINRVNKPGYDSWDLTFTNGTGDSLHKVFNLIVNPGDVVLIESYTYVPVVTNIINYGGIVVPVELDFQNGGIDVAKFKDLLENWDKGKYSHLPKPKALYTIPTGQNPTGISLSNTQRKEIYDIVDEHGVLIIEDDPYGYIQLGKYTDGEYNKFDQEDYSIDEYINQDLPNSYIQYDTKGIVLRLESFSKVFAPGTRLGFIVGHEEFIKRIAGHALASTRAPSGISQVIVHGVIEQFGGVEGWLKWNTKVSREYTSRKNLLLKTLFNSASFKKGQFEVIEPAAGMFVSLNINFPKPQGEEEEDYRDQVEQLRYKTIEGGALVVIGKNFSVDETFSKKAKFIRLTIATQDGGDEILEAGARLTKSIENYFESV